MSNTKTRDISTYDFLQALQQEYICIEIRSKIYIYKNDRDYFKSLMDKKESAIRTISRKNRLENILDNPEEYIRVWQTVVPEFGMPKLIYNIHNVSEKQLTFPYKGTVVCVKESGEHGISEHVNFKVEPNTISIEFYDAKCLHSLSEVERASPQKTDEYYYYYPYNSFQCNLGNKKVMGKLSTYSMIDKTAIVMIDNDPTWLMASNISRIL